MSKLVFLHVPHTGGRVIRTALNQITDIIWVHNYNHIKENLEEIEKTNQTYFVLRNPLERIIGEYIHYSKFLVSFSGRVNHLQVREIIKKDPNFDWTSIISYCQLEANINQYCKFLLCRTDFDIPISSDDFDTIINLFESKNKPLFDVYKFPLELPILNELLGINIELNLVPNSNKNKYIHDTIICDKIRELNKYDFLLYNKLFSI